MARAVSDEQLSREILKTVAKDLKNGRSQAAKILGYASSFNFSGKRSSPFRKACRRLVGYTEVTRWGNAERRVLLP
jgi:hypothetical protein